MTRRILSEDLTIVVSAKQKRNGLWVPDIRMNPEPAPEDRRDMDTDLGFKTKVEAERHGMKIAETELIIRNVERYGWHATYIRAPYHEGPRGWCFTVGLHHTFNHAEILIFGEEKLAYRAVNRLACAIESGKVFEHGKEYHGIIPRARCCFQAIEKVWYPPFFESLTNPYFQRQDFPALQCVCSRRGKYPWDKQFERRLLPAQPLLFYPDPQRARTATLLRAMGIRFDTHVPAIH